MKKFILLVMIFTNRFPFFKNGNLSFLKNVALYAQSYGVNNVKRDHLQFRSYDHARIPGAGEAASIDDTVTVATAYALYAPKEALSLAIASPCSVQSILNGNRITDFFNKEGYKTSFAELVKANSVGVGIEYAAVFGISNVSGEAMSLPKLTTSAANSVSIKVNPPELSVTAIGHTHPDNVFPAPSAGDLYAFGMYARDHPDFLYYILAANGSNYVLMVTGPDELNAFLKKFPQKTNIEPDSLGNMGRGANYNPGSELYLTMKQIATDILVKSVDPANPTLAELDAAHEIVQAYILDHFHTGMTLYKQDVTGKFNEIHAIIQNPGPVMKVTPCK